MFVLLDGFQPRKRTLELMLGNIRKLLDLGGYSEALTLDEALAVQMDDGVDRECCELPLVVARLDFPLATKHHGVSAVCKSERRASLQERLPGDGQGGCCHRPA